MDKIAVSVKNIKKSYKLYPKNSDRIKETFHPFRKKYHHDFWAVNDVSFEITRGKVLGIMGRNGSGKSTLLQIVSGILRPTSGTVIVNGTVAALLELGAGFNPEYSGRDNVYLSGRLLGFNREKMDNIFDNIAAFADIGEFLDQPVKTYSSGMYVRLAFAVQVCVNPDVLIIDEALSVGDIFFQQKCFTKMHEIISKGTTCVFVSHDTSAIQNLCDQVILLNRGEVEYSGDPDEAVSRYYSSMGKKRVSVAEPEKSCGEKGGNTGHSSGFRMGGLTHNLISAETKRYHPQGRPDLHIKAVSITDPELNHTFQVNMMEQLVFRILIRADHDVAEPNCGIDFHDRFGNLVFATGSTQQKTYLPSMKKGDELLVTFRITFSVQPGEYTYSIGVAEPSDGMNPNVGYVHERIEKLGVIVVTYDKSMCFPFYGIAMLPTEVQFSMLSTGR